MQMVVTDGNQNVRLSLGKLLAHHGDSLFDLGGAWGLLRLLEKARHEWVVGDADNCDEFSHGLPPGLILFVFNTTDL
jgi:hypothetical protein